jgi:fatty-acid peroxygenase
VVRWCRAGRVVLFDELAALLFRIACAWSGIPVPEQATAERRTGELKAMIAGAGGIGPSTWHALLLRRKTERWAEELVMRVRGGDLAPGAPTALGVIASHRDDKERPLPPAVAAVELLNVLRPTVAVAYFGVFAALALHERPDCAQAVADPEYRMMFVDEVRRLYPFFPMVAGRALTPFPWRGRRFERGDWVILDLYGTNRDPALWAEPERFDPARFRTRRPGPFDLIPQGGGSYMGGHRCPGEAATRVLLDVLVTTLTQAMRYDVPDQDLSVDLATMPTLPASGFVIENVR